MSTVSANRFSTVVKRRLIENKEAGRRPDSIRGLAKTMAESQGNPRLAETYKRSLFKWMSNRPDSPRPSSMSRELVAECLGGVKAAELDDDEEADPVLREAFCLFVDLMDRLETRRHLLALSTGR
jgi:hypothetical protein